MRCQLLGECLLFNHLNSVYAAEDLKQGHHPHHSYLSYAYNLLGGLTAYGLVNDYSQFCGLIHVEFIMLKYIQANNIIEHGLFGKVDLLGDNQILLRIYEYMFIITPLQSLTIITRRIRIFQISKRTMPS